MEMVELNTQSKSPGIYPKELSELIRPLSDIRADRINNNMGSFDVEEHNLREIYTISCQEHQVEPNKHIIRQLSPVIGNEWLKKVRILDLSLVYLGADGCSALVPVIAFSSALTHLIMPSVGLTEESARPLCAAGQVHPSLTWIDVSGNCLTDNVGRWIFSMVLENHHIRFVILRNTGISFPLIRKIEQRLKCKGKAHASEYTQFSQTLDLRRLSTLGYSLSTTSCATNDSTRTRRLPSSVAAGLAELRHRLYRNRYCLEYVYRCFMLPQHKDDNNVEELVDVMRMNGEWDTVSISTIYSGRCSWRVFFRGLRLLGIHAVSRSLTESVVFATTCGICNLETISFGKLLSFLRPHVTIKKVTSRKTLNSMCTSFSCISKVCPFSSPITRSAAPFPFQLMETNTTTGVILPSIVSSTPLTITPLTLMQCAKSSSEHVFSKEFDMVNRGNFSKPQDSLPIKKQSFRRVSFTCSLADLSLGPSPFATSLPVSNKTLEERFELDRFFTSRSVQYVVDRLFDAQNALRESFQPTEKLSTTAPQMIPLDEVVHRALLFVGEELSEIVKTLLEPWKVNVDGCIRVDTEGLFGSIYIPDSKGPNGIPFPLSEEKCMWRTVDVDALRCSLNQW
ncbi:hypothetical protein LSM04_001256 [Trypanosoma melophagium]|uniref:uncharacterized protein n=1 Tax=Trypanosoma melophagium TaxID=715481 RepID=UPI00351A3C7A|nr:hypothetical protein LSM04_001256 [Trypanosoma melophagium]